MGRRLGAAPRCRIVGGMVAATGTLDHTVLKKYQAGFQVDFLRNTLPALYFLSSLSRRRSRFPRGGNSHSQCTCAAYILDYSSRCTSDDRLSAHTRHGTGALSLTTPTIFRLARAASATLRPDART